VIGAPARRKAWSARSELPHMTNCGLPFMNTATGDVSITLLIRSCSTSLTESPLS
jgi:hypothetical protein